MLSRVPRWLVSGLDQFRGEVGVTAAAGQHNMLTIPTACHQQTAQMMEDDILTERLLHAVPTLIASGIDDSGQCRTG